MRILVTGGAGFIGSHLVRALLRQGDEVVVFDRVPVPHLLQDIMDSITYVQGDSSSDLDLYRAVATNGIEGIFHLGALMAGVCEQNPPLAFQVNFRSTQVLLDAAVACGVKRFSSQAPSPGTAPTSVEPCRKTRRDPATSHGRTKLAEASAALVCDIPTSNSGASVPTPVWGPNHANGLTAIYDGALAGGSIARGGRCTSTTRTSGAAGSTSAVRSRPCWSGTPKTRAAHHTVCAAITLREVRNDQPPLPETKVTLPEPRREPPRRMRARSGRPRRCALHSDGTLCRRRSPAG